MFHESLLTFRGVLALLAVLYMGGGVYIRIRYSELHFSLSAMFISLGAAVFIGANNNTWFEEGTQAALFAEAAIALLILAAWVFSMWAAVELSKLAGYTDGGGANAS